MAQFPASGKWLPNSSLSHITNVNSLPPAVRDRYAEQGYRDEMADSAIHEWLDV